MMGPDNTYLSATISSLASHYQLLPALLVVAGIVLSITATKLLIRVSATLLGVLAADKYQREFQQKKAWIVSTIRAARRSGGLTHLMIALLILPFCTTLESQPLLKILGHGVLILMTYDFLYYLLHRFLLHRKGLFLRIHAVHHQVRNPCSLDSSYVHPAETSLVLGLLGFTIASLAPWFGPFHVITLILTYLVYLLANMANHTHFQSDNPLLKPLHGLSRVHHTHHHNMHTGNFATITPLYDKLFGTLE